MKSSSQCQNIPECFLDYFEIGIASVFEDYFHYVNIFGLDCRVQRR